MSSENVSAVVDFTDLTLAERVAATNQRLGEHQGRISSIEELLEHQGEKIYMVVSPFGKSDQHDIGTCFIWEWSIGRVIDQYGQEMTSSAEVETPNEKGVYRRPILESATDPDNIISLKDFNVIPNNYNNHAVFVDQSKAHAYLMYRKVSFDEMKTLEKLDGEYPYWFTHEHIKKFAEMEDQISSQ